MKKILVIEEEPELRRLIEYNIDKNTKDVVSITVGTRQEGEDIFVKNADEIIAVFVDGTLPDGDEASLVRKLRGEYYFIGEIVAMSGDQTIQEDLMKAGCTKSLPKPFSFAELVKIIGYITQQEVS